MNASDQGNKQSIYGGNGGSSQSESQGYAEHEADMGIDGYGEVRRLDRHQREGSRQSASGQEESGSRQGGAQSAS